MPDVNMYVLCVFTRLHKCDIIAKPEIWTSEHWIRDTVLTVVLYPFQTSIETRQNTRN